MTFRPRSWMGSAENGSHQALFYRRRQLLSVTSATQGTSEGKAAELRFNLQASGLLHGWVTVSIRLIAVLTHSIQLTIARPNASGMMVIVDPGSVSAALSGWHCSTEPPF